jgi:integrase
MRIPRLTTHATGQYLVRIRGTSYYLGREKPAALTRYRELLAEHYGAGPAAAPAGACLTVAELLERFEAAQLAQCPERWRQKRLDKFKQILPLCSKLYGTLPVTGFGPACLVTVRKKVSEKAGRCRGYVNDLARKVKAAFKWGVWNELVPLEVYTRLALVPDLKRGELGLPEGRARGAVPASVVAEVLPYLNERAADVVRLLQLTAARPDEIVRLRAADLREREGVWVYAPAEHKTAHAGRRRLIVFNAEAQGILAKYLAGKGPQDWLFPADPFQAPGQHYGVTSLRNAVTSACHRAGVPRFTPYQLRHLRITEVAMEHGLDVAQALAGHSSAAMTAHYDHGQLQRAKKAVG